MKRRTLLAAVGASTGFAGCLGWSPGSIDSRAGAEQSGERGHAVEPTTHRGADSRTIAHDGVPRNICRRPVVPDSGIYAIDEPVFGTDWQDISVRPRYRYRGSHPALADEQMVVGLEAGGRTRAYPLSILYDHEVVNDDFGGPVLVTYCPLCRSAMIAERRVRGEPTTFGVSGRLWTPDRVRVEAARRENRVRGVVRSGADGVAAAANRNLVLYDRATRSYWSQILARGICGPEAGSRLTIRPSTVATWGRWQRDHPDTDVLLPPPVSSILRPGPAAEETPA